MYPAVQANPQAPQFSRSLVRSRQEPEQFCMDSGQETTQDPPLQTRPGPQTLPQVPQFSWS